MRSIGYAATWMLMCSWLLAAHHRELTVVRREASLAIVMTVDLSRLVLDLVKRGEVGCKEISTGMQLY